MIFLFSCYVSTGEAQVHSICSIGNISCPINQPRVVKSLDVTAGPQERITACVPMETVLEDSSSDHQRNDYDWVYHRSLDAAEIDIHSDKQFESIIEKVLCNMTCGVSFTNILRQRRVEKSVEEQETAEKGPRTISQVRKDNSRKDGVEGGSAKPELDNTALYPKCMKDLTKTHERNGTAGIIFIWKCSWKGSVRYGMQITPPLTISPTVRLNTNIPNMFATGSGSNASSWQDLMGYNSILRASASYLSLLRQLLSDSVIITIRHPQSVCLAGTARVSVDISTSVTEMELYLSIECVDKRSIALVNSSSSAYNTQLKRSSMLRSSEVYQQLASTSAAAYNAAVSTIANNNMIKNTVLRWEGQTRVAGYRIIPNRVNTIEFECSFLHPGIYDLNR